MTGRQMVVSHPSSLGLESLDGGNGRLSRFPRRICGSVGASLGLFSSSSSVCSRESCSDQRKQPDACSYASKKKRPSSPLGRSSGSVSSLPLGAKVGLTVLEPWIAWATETCAFIIWSRRYRNWLRRLGCTFGCLGLLRSSTLVWWQGDSAEDQGSSDE